MVLGDLDSLTIPIQNGLGVGWLLECNLLLASPLLSRILTKLGSNLGGHLLLRGPEHVSVIALVSRANGEDMAFQIFACPLLQYLARHGR